MTAKSQMLWTFAITSIALFMVTLDNLVVTTALPVIRDDLACSEVTFVGPAADPEHFHEY
jgi:hypothetical protein